MKDTIHDKTTDKMFDAEKRRIAEKQEKLRRQVELNASKLHRPAWMPPPPIHRKVIGVAPGVKVRSFYDGELK